MCPGLARWCPDGLETGRRRMLISTTGGQPMRSTSSDGYLQASHRQGDGAPAAEMMPIPPERHLPAPAGIDAVRHWLSMCRITGRFLAASVATQWHGHDERTGVKCALPPAPERRGFFARPCKSDGSDQFGARGRCSICLSNPECVNPAREDLRRPTPWCRRRSARASISVPAP